MRSNILLYVMSSAYFVNDYGGPLWWTTMAENAKATFWSKYRPELIEYSKNEGEQTQQSVLFFSKPPCV